jgi:hypothetical protein
VTENDASGIFNLIIEEFAKVLHVHLALVGVNNGCSSVELCSVCVRIFYCGNNVGELSYARGLDKYPVGMILVYHLLESFCEIADQGATDTS